jgi:outer membrane protein X
MKKLSILLILGLLVYAPIKSQVTKFKFELGGIYGLPTDDAFKGGVGFYVHPSYYFSDKLNVGLKAEWAILGSSDDLGTAVSISALGSYLVTTNYYFTVSKVRPYAGVGLGLYSMGSVSVGSAVNIEYGNKFGVAPKIGLDLGHFTLNVAYNAIFGTDSEMPNKNYLSLGVGIFFGGGVKGRSKDNANNDAEGEDNSNVKVKKTRKNQVITIDDM